MKIIQDVIAEAMREVFEDAERVERENRKSGTPISRAYDAGRVVGMADLIEAVNARIRTDTAYVAVSDLYNEKS